MALTVPEWLDESFLASCLQNDDPASRNTTVTSFYVHAGVPDGNNYASQILRVILHYRREHDSDIEKSISLIVKAPKITTTSETIQDELMRTEPNFYDVFLPKLHEINQLKIAPKSYPSPIEYIIVLEDLRESNFTMINKHIQLDFEHCKQYFIIAAKLHATGVALKKNEPALCEMFPGAREKFMDETYGKEIIQAEVIGLMCLAKSIKGMGLDNYKYYSDIIENLATESVLRQENVNCVKKPHFKSFIHGDSWTTNILFKHDDSGKPTDIRLVDFQIFNYDAVVCDIINFTWRSANNNVQQHKLDELYKIYCNTLNSTLDQLGCSERLYYDQLKTEIQENSIHALIMIGVFLPLTLAEEIINVPYVFSGKSNVNDIMVYYRGNHFLSKFPEILKFADQQGIFKWLKENSCVPLNN